MVAMDTLCNTLLFYLMRSLMVLLIMLMHSII